MHDARRAGAGGGSMLQDAGEGAARNQTLSRPNVPANRRAAPTHAKLKSRAGPSG